MGERRRSSRILKSVAERTAGGLVRRVGPLGRLVVLLADAVREEGYRRLRERFIANGASSKWSEEDRAELVRRFEAVDASIPLASSPADGLFLAEALLSLEAEGHVVECGCFAGGSTAKLSLVCAHVGRRLHVFDSFEGLPEVGDWDLHDYHARKGSEWVTAWTAGRYASRLEVVRDHVARLGDVDVCSFHKGWFKETLTPGNLPEQIAMAFTDVDIPRSARECITAIWPRLQRGGVYFSHDVAYIKVLQVLMDAELWNQGLCEFPPVLFGAGSGLCDASPHLGYFVKGRKLDADYLNRLTIRK